MVNGTRPAKHLHYVRKFKHAFGGIEIPDFNLDSGLNGMPDQEKDNAPYECTGYTAADILTDIFRTPFSPDFSYAAARYIAGDGPEGTQGTSFHAAGQSMVAVGGLNKNVAPINASQQGEKYISDWNNWNPSQRFALSYIQNGLRNVLGLGDAFDSIRSAAFQGGIGISIGSPWFPEWTNNINGGIVQVPNLTGSYSTWHNYAVKGQKTINGVPYLIVKSWQGTRVGDNGWLYFSRETINAALSVPGSGALTIDKSAVRWISLLGILTQRFPALLSYLPALLKVQ